MEMTMSGKNFIKKAINPEHKGALRKKLGAKKGKDIPAEKLAAATNSKNPLTRKQANLAMTLKKMKKK